MSNAFNVDEALDFIAQSISDPTAKQMFSLMVSNFNSLNDTVSTQKAHIAQQLKIIENLENQINAREHQAPMDTNHSDGETEADLKERLRSAVIYGIKESTESKINDKLREDQSKIADILELTETQSPFISFRMGRLGSKPRPLKVIFPSRDIQKQFIVGAKTIKDQLIPTKIFIRASKSESERKNDATMRSTIKDLKSKYNQLNLVIYAGQICLRGENGEKPTVLDHKTYPLL